MVEINKTSITSFLTPIEGDKEIGKVSLFLVSNKSKGLKKINLEGLSVEERTNKLRTWGQEYRFVLVIEKGDMVFAHAHAKYVQQLQDLREISLNNRKVTVKALSDEEAAQVSAIGEAFEDYVLQSEEANEESEEKSKEKVEKGLSFQDNFKLPPSLAGNQLIRDKKQTYFLIEQMVKRNLGQIIADCMKHYQEARAELKKQLEEEERQSDIKKEEINKKAQRSEVKDKEVKQKDLDHTIIAENDKHIQRIRGSRE